MANAKKIKLFCFEVFNKIDNHELKEPITDILVASDLIHKGNILCAFGAVENTENTTRTSIIKEITFAKGEIHLITQNSDYLVVMK